MPGSIVWVQVQEVVVYDQVLLTLPDGVLRKARLPVYGQHEEECLASCEASTNR